MPIEEKIEIHFRGKVRPTVCKTADALSLFSIQASVWLSKQTKNMFLFAIIVLPPPTIPWS